MVIDAMDGVTKQDQSLAGMIVDSGRAIIVVVNKWVSEEALGRKDIDGYKNLKHFLTTYEESLKSLFFTPNHRYLFVSFGEF